MRAGNPLRAAIIGAGLMGRWHADAVRRAGGNVVLIADADPARALKLADICGARVARSTQEAISSVDVVHVCTPPAGREAIISAALDACRHVLAEKPLAATAGIVAGLHSRAASAGVLLCPVHQFLFQQGTLRAAALRDDIAPVRQVSAEISSAGADGGSEKARDQLAFDILPHPLALGERLIPGGLSGMRWLGVRAAPGQIHIIGTARGVSFSVQLSTTTRPTCNMLRLAGDRGSIHADLFHGFAVVEPGKVSRLRKATRPFTVSASTLVAATENLTRRAMRNESAFPGLRELVARFYSAVAEGGAAPISADESIAVAAARDDIIALLRIEGAVA